MPISCRESQTSKRHQRRSIGVPARSVPPHSDGDGFFSNKAWAGIVKKLGVSPREGEVARCVLAGLGDQQIAEKLGVSLSTIQTHMNRIYKRLAIHRRTELVKRIFFCWSTRRGRSDHRMMHHRPR
jgi:DNA-binding NarL/FixJ family response regulator